LWPCEQARSPVTSLQAQNQAGAPAAVHGGTWSTARIAITPLPPIQQRAHQPRLSSCSSGSAPSRRTPAAVMRWLSLTSSSRSWRQCCATMPTTASVVPSHPPARQQAVQHASQQGLILARGSATCSPGTSKPQASALRVEFTAQPLPTHQCSACAAQSSAAAGRPALARCGSSTSSPGPGR